MQITITKEELTLLVNALESREFKFAKIKDIHAYLLHKIDECDNLEKANETKDAFSDQEPDVKPLGVTPPNDAFAS